MTPRNAAAEAGDTVGDPRLTVRVLEPSPPASTDEDFFADDPAARGEGDLVVTPTSAGDMTWGQLVIERPELSEFASDHWLANHRALRPTPPSYREAREDYHRVAYAVVAEARRIANGKFGLRHTRGGFGTPFFGDDEQVRVEGADLVVQRGDEVVSAPLTTLRAAAELAGVEPSTAAAEHDSPELGDIDRVLRADPEVGAFLADWFAMALATLEELRVTPGAIDVSRTQLWPGHFDPATEMGDANAGGRATYGASPGDAAIDTPYLYVGAWGEIPSDPFWNATTFNGALLGYDELVDGADPVARALAFYREAYERLTA